MKKTKQFLAFILASSLILASCSKDSPKDNSTKAGKFKMVITTSEPIDPELSIVSFTFAAVKSNFPVKCEANFAKPDDDNAAIDEDTLATYGTPITVTSVSPVDNVQVTVGYGGIQQPAPLKLHMEVYYGDKMLDEKNLSLTTEIQAVSYTFKANGESITY
ncbi:hypothetical protein SAMN05192529_11772 [Arachidicoccus rhizosphaerae]|uniref:Lipocalin-like domain-containing protein n=1 Tax=Arachidicoccus rhizosphaerae TaxID=551991 RepID=A0A1H4B038_9BACT|nr:hypothetical protein [Arachidicoccus rhizosphaerae]SEA41541.1 hypothetical protein SAMN05192529_11772 [Arachidicoccus rhizosphaerae]